MLRVETDPHVPPGVTAAVFLDEEKADAAEEEEEEEEREEEARVMQKSLRYAF